MFLVAVTGGIACGKTKVCEVFQKHYNVAVVNADAISRESKENFIELVFNDKIVLCYLLC